MFILIPETIPIMIKVLEDARDWVRGRRTFFVLSGIALWLYLFIKGIIWLFVHVRFV